MSVFLITTILFLHTVQIGQPVKFTTQYRIKTVVTETEMKDMAECEALKYQKAFLPPANSMSTEMYYCEER